MPSVRTLVTGMLVRFSVAVVYDGARFHVRKTLFGASLEAVLLRDDAIEHDDAVFVQTAGRIGFG